MPSPSSAVEQQVQLIPNALVGSWSENHLSTASDRGMLFYDSVEGYEEGSTGSSSSSDGMGGETSEEQEVDMELYQRQRALLTCWSQRVDAQIRAMERMREKLVRLGAQQQSTPPTQPIASSDLIHRHIGEEQGGEVLFVAAPLVSTASLRADITAARSVASDARCVTKRSQPSAWNGTSSPHRQRQEEARALGDPANNEIRNGRRELKQNIRRLMNQLCALEELVTDYE